ncbi:Gypsy retrotransposon integrase-like protein 1 [Trichinella papuae]|uniref:Gypsy retrotransposon integrase-like protein 1 n=1 Tax=Trichinella papuae TaxID=268474 RepID=A0A0V1MV06_9BILA|nr:Gypsy retrotransposon integrase-like protein 1 [Trichinella papuae]
MDNLAQRRAAQLRWLKFAMGNMETALDGSAETRQICFAKLMDTWSRYEEIITKLLDSAMDQKEIDIYTEERETVCADITEFKVKVENKERELVAQERKSTDSVPISQAGSSNVRLPKLEIKKFSGEYHDWQRFHDEFEATINSNPNLSLVEKFNYLRSLLSGNAETAIQGLTLNAVNYETALTILNEKFGDPQLLIEEHLKSLQNLPVITNQWDSKRLEIFVNDMEINMRGLETLKTPPVVYQAVLMPLILSRLPREISVEWKRQNPNRQKGMYELLSFLKTELRSREVSTFAWRERKSVPPFPSNRKTVPRGQYTTAALQATVRKACFICEEDHAIENCPKFIRMNPKERITNVKRLRLCFLCLKRGHSVASCKAKLKCRIEECSKRHHPLIHLNQDRRSVSENQPNIPEENKVHVTHAMVGNRGTLLQSARARLYNEEGNSMIINCLFDSGSQRSFVKKSVAEALSLKGPYETVSIESFGNISSECLRVRRVKFWLTSVRNTSHNKQMVEALCLKKITDRPNVRLDIKQYSHFTSLQLAEDFTDLSSTFDVLIGLDYYYDFINQVIIKGQEGEPMAIHSTLGWIICGPIPGKVMTKSIKTLFAKVEDHLDDILKKFWDMEAIGIKDEEKGADSKALQLFEKTVRFDGERYEVQLPWSNEESQLPNNYKQALDRLIQTERSLRRNPTKAQLYDNGMKEYLENGFVEEVNDVKGRPGRTWYLPHHTVLREDKSSTKCRIVFDGSAQFRNDSLNRQLDPGPPLQNDLVQILLRFRRFRVGLQADISKMFLQIGLHEKDRDVTRFLWRELGSQEAPRIFRFRRVCFGLTCSPFLAMSVTRRHALNHLQGFPLGANQVLENMYVDDIVFSVDENEVAMETVRQLMMLMKKGGFHLTKWVSNMKAVLADLPAEDIIGKNTMMSKTLGIVWDSANDELAYSVLPEVDPWSRDTKRQLISVTAKLYDPLGHLSPYIIRAKVLFQKLWQKGLNWDDELPSDLQKEWQTWKLELYDISDIRIPRCLIPFHGSTINKVELHAFGDASETAYGAVVYLVVTKEDHSTISNLVMAKSRVAPLKKMTLPRLELMAAQVAAKLITFVKDALKMRIDRLTCWTDSKITLCWIKGTSRRWKPFIKNRVENIQKLVEPSQWRHCPTNSNPADILSRGSTITRLRSNSLWWSGPTWLIDEDSWPKDLESAKLEDYDVEYCVTEERRSVKVLAELVENISLNPERYEHLDRLLRITAYCIRFGKNCRLPKSERLVEYLTPLEMQNAENHWIRKAQHERFANEIRQLSNGRQIAANSRLQQFDPFIDEHGLLRIGGRLQNSDLPENTKHPILLPDKHPITTAIIRRCHLRQLHSGCELTLATLRQRYWILRGRRAVKGVIYACPCCRRIESRPFVAKMAPLPADRIRVTRPFENTGLDLAGPFFTRKGKKVNKNYICLFTCMTTRAVHLEVVSEMTAPRLLQALRRFIARRGKPCVLQSDNFKSFKQLDKELRQLVSVEMVDNIARELTSHRIEWNFITERAPWMGGYWERLIRSMKTSLKKILQNSMLEEEEFRTVISEVEARMNSRPLTYLTDNPNNPEVLTPYHFLTGTHYVDIPEVTKDEDEWVPKTQTTSQLMRNWNLRQRLIAQWWKRWKAEYVTNLNIRQKWYNSGNAPNTGDIVLVSECNVPRRNWKLGKIVELYPGRDGIVRTVKVQLAGGSVNRPISKLHLIEPAKVQ